MTAAANIKDRIARIGAALAGDDRGACEGESIPEHYEFHRGEIYGLEKALEWIEASQAAVTLT